LSEIPKRGASLSPVHNIHEYALLNLPGEAKMALYAVRK